MPGFFDLPGELRNRIYEYALTSDRAIVKYQTPMRSNDLVKPIFTTTKRSSLLKHRTGPNNEFNQLQYVNRQLRMETHGLELRLNKLDLTIHYTASAPGLSAESHLWAFLTHLSPSWATVPLEITLEDWPLPFRRPIAMHNGIPSYTKEEMYDPFANINLISAVASWCRNNPKSSITWGLSRLHISCPRGTDIGVYTPVARAVIFSMLKGGRAMDHLYNIPNMGWTTDPHFVLAQRIGRNITVQDLNLPNLVFKPVITFTKADWPAMIQDSLLEWCYHGQALCVQLEDWCTNGF